VPFCVQFHIVYNLVADRTERGVFFLEDDRRVVGVLKSKLTGLADVSAKSVLEQTNNILSSSTKWLGSPGEIRLLSRIYQEWPELFSTSPVPEVGSSTIFTLMLQAPDSDYNGPVTIYPFTRWT